MNSLPGSLVPKLLDGLLIERVGHESVVWSPVRADPHQLDPISTIMLDVVDGTATVDELASDVADVVGLSREHASTQVSKVIQRLAAIGALVASPVDVDAHRDRELFVNPPST